MQYTIRKIPDHLDAALRNKARREGRSLNEVAIDALLRAMGLAGEPIRNRELRDLAGTWSEDPETEAVLDEHRRVDTEDWQ